MKKTKTEIKYTLGLVTLFAVCFVLTAALVVNSGTAFSWFASNREVSGTGMNVSMKPINANIYIYEYDYAGRSLSAISEINCNMSPGDEATFVVIARRNVAETVNVGFGIADVSVNYYGLQGAADLGAFVEPYMRAGDYTYENNGQKTTLSPYDTAIDTNAYLSFVRPVSNAIMISRATLVLSSADISAAVEDSERQLAAAYDGDDATVSDVGAFSVGQPLYASAHNPSPAQLTAAAADEYFTLNDAADTPADFDDIGLTTDDFYVIIYKLVFDGSVYVTSSISVDSMLTDVTMENSNAFMYQNFRITNIGIPADVAGEVPNP